MSVHLFRHAWGAVGSDFTWRTLHGLARDAAKEGYESLEFPLFYFDMQADSTEKTEADFREGLAETGLSYIPLIVQPCPNAGVILMNT